MVKRIGRQQRKTRHKFKRSRREKGKISLSQYFQELAPGQKVGLKINSAVQKGQFYRRFHGLTGTIQSRRGFCYVVSITDGDKDKTVYVHPIHLVKL